MNIIPLKKKYLSSHFGRFKAKPRTGNSNGILKRNSRKFWMHRPSYTFPMLKENNP